MDADKGGCDRRVAESSTPRIVGFRQDEDGQWVAELSCGHSRHVRHDPPWEERSWTLTAEGRRSRIGQALRCRACDEARS